MISRPSARLTLILASATAMLSTGSAFAATDPAAVVKNYVELAHAKYEDALITAKTWTRRSMLFWPAPSDETLKAAKDAWIKARVPYQQTEAYRFGNPIVDDWEGKVNSWPLDEGLIDYVDKSYGTESDENEQYTLNVIANPKFTIGGKEIDATKITPELLSTTLQSAGETDANVATGYHAIEFLLWGQDLNGTGPGAGNRPVSDYDLKNCTNGNCDRRAEYLKVASALLVGDLEDMTKEWTPEGEAAKAVLADPKKGISAMLTGMGSLSYGELAGERMKLGLLLHDPEEEHDCFSDNTYNSHLNDAIGIADTYWGKYTRVDGTKIEGPSLSQLVAEKDPAIDKEMTAKLTKTLDAMHTMAKRGETVEKYDQMIGEGNKEGNAVVQAAIDGLVDQTKTIERVITALDLGAIKLEGSDSLDNPNAVFK
jgi:putative iron-regulated protein